MHWGIINKVVFLIAFVEGLVICDFVTSAVHFLFKIKHLYSKMNHRMLPRIVYHLFYIYIYSFSRHFYPKTHTIVEYNKR